MSRKNYLTCIKYGNTNTICEPTMNTFATYIWMCHIEKKVPLFSFLCESQFESELCHSAQRCMSVSLSAFLRFSRHDSQGSEQDREGVKESFCLRQWSNLSRGPVYTLPSALYGDKSLEHSLLSIYFLTVKTCIQSWEEWNMPEQLYTLEHSVEVWLVSEQC